MDLHQYERKVFSQNGEDGIIAELLRRCGSTNRTCVEMSVGDGTECNTRLLRETGWTGLAVGTAPWANDAWITPDTVVDLLREAGTPTDLDLLSLDIDGNDFWVLREILREFSPRIVVVEYNALMGPDASVTLPCDPTHRWDATDAFGASLQALAALAASHGYGLLGCESRGVNAFFLRTDVLAKCLFVPPGYPPFPSGPRTMAGVHVPRPSGMKWANRGPKPLKVDRDRATLESRSQAGAFCQPQRDGSVLCRALDAIDMFVDPTDKSVAHWIITLGFWEAWITVGIGRLLAEGQTVVNVGANLGYYALMAAACVGPRGKVWAFEPQPPLADLIRRSAAHNAMEQVVVVNAAVGDGSQSEATLSIPDGMLGGASIVQDERPPELLVPEHEAMVTGRREISVPCVTLDSMAGEIGPVDLVIIDAEGFEQRIWNGMQQLLDASPGITLVLEFSPTWYADPRGFLAQIRAKDFSLRLIDYAGKFVPVSDEEIVTGELGMIVLSRST